jgi:putative PIN family toxin of toxin-antitoxin system
MALRLVLDTNVWLDWLVFDDPGIAALKAAVGTGTATILIDACCLGELQRVLAYPLRKTALDEAQRAASLATCHALAQFVETRPAPGLPRCADPDDQKFLELAAAAGADALLTKDLALLALARRPALPFHIMTPARFLADHGVKSIG